MNTLVIADTQPLFRGALARLAAGTCAEHGLTPSIREYDTLEAIPPGQDHLALVLDTALLEEAAAASLGRLRAQWPKTPILLLAAAGSTDLTPSCMQAGASGILPKTASAAEIAAALGIILRGGITMPRPSSSLRAAPAQEECALSTRQAAVLGLVSDGKSNKQIAWELAISETTVKAHMSAVLRKLGVSSRTQAIVLLQRRGGAVRLTSRSA